MMMVSESHSIQTFITHQTIHSIFHIYHIFSFFQTPQASMVMMAAEVAKTNMKPLKKRPSSITSAPQDTDTQSATVTSLDGQVVTSSPSSGSLVSQARELKRKDSGSSGSKRVSFRLPKFGKDRTDEQGSFQSLAGVFSFSLSLFFVFLFLFFLLYFLLT